MYKHILTMPSVVSSSIFMLCSCHRALAIDCTGPLATTWSGPDPSCPDTKAYHWWPVGWPSSDCHGWRTTVEGRQQENSAKNIHFSEDGKTLFYDEYPMSINCSGSPQSKKFVLGECQQGNSSPELYDIGMNFACANLTFQGCMALHGVPHVDELDAKSFKNGEECDKATDWLGPEDISSRNFTAEELKYTIKLGMSFSNSFCNDIGPRTEVTWVVANTTYDVCQGGYHYPYAYPNKSDAHLNSATKITCVDGGITYTQHPFVLDCNSSKTMNKREYTTGCHEGFPLTVYTVITDFSGCEKQGFKPSADGKAYVLSPEVMV